jgi:hypothetical protein
MMVKILVEKHIHSKDPKSDDEVEIESNEEDIQFLFEDLKKSIDKTVKSREYSHFVDLKKLPVVDVKKYRIELEREKLWSKVKKLPTRIEEVQKHKQLIRLGIPFEFKKRVYFACVDAAVIIEADKNLYQRNFLKVFGTFYKKENLLPKDVKPSIVAEFGGKLNPEEHYLTDEGIEAAKRLLCVIGSRYSEVEYCPSLIQLICYLLYIMDEHEVYGIVSRMVERNMKDGWYFRITKLTHQLFVESFKDILKKSLQTVYKRKHI